jgi:DNA-binding PadR family transcriptional regulator
MLKYILLGFIWQKPSTGYELKQVLDNSTGYFWHAYHSQIYTTLRKLEQDGLITTHIKNGNDHLTRRICRITPTGQDELLEWLNDPLMETSKMKEDLLVRVFFSGVRSTPEVEAELRLQRKLHEQRLGEYLDLADQDDDAPCSNPPEVPAAELGEFYQAAILQFGVAYEKMYLNWLDSLITELEKV